MPEKFDLEFKKSAHKELLTIHQPDLKRLVDKIAKLALEPLPADALKLTGTEGYRLRQGDWRIVYTVDVEKRQVVIVKVAHRREAYR